MVQKTGSGRSRDSLGTGRDAVRGRGRPPGPRRLAPGAPGTRRRHAKRPARRAWPGGSALATTAWPHYKVLFPSYWNESSRSLLRCGVTRWPPGRAQRGPRCAGHLPSLRGSAAAALRRRTRPLRPSARERVSLRGARIRKPHLLTAPASPMPPPPTLPHAAVPVWVSDVACRRRSRRGSVQSGLHLPPPQVHLLDARRAVLSLRGT